MVVAAQARGRFARRQRERARGWRGCERAVSRAKASAGRLRTGGRRGGRGVAWEEPHAAAVSAPWSRLYLYVETLNGESMRWERSDPEGRRV